MRVDKAEIIATLRARGLRERAEWVDRALPLIIDTSKNGSLLRMLHIDPATMSPAGSAPRNG